MHLIVEVSNRNIIMAYFMFMQLKIIMVIILKNLFNTLKMIKSKASASP